MKLPPLILASASPRRAELLRQAGMDFKIIPSNAEEVFDGHWSPRELCQLNAHLKARAIARQFPGALVLGADTLVFLGDETFGKPRDLGEAKRMLAKLQGRTHQVVTGVSLIHLGARRERIFAVSTDVKFLPLTATQIGVYLSKINPLDKAGAYAAQEHGSHVIADISGSRSNVIGLPMERLREELGCWRRH